MTRLHCDVPTDRACEAYAESIEADMKAVRAAKAVGMPVPLGGPYRTVPHRLLVMKREAMFARGVARRYETLATTRGIRARADDSKMVLDNARQFAQDIRP